MGVLEDIKSKTYMYVVISDIDNNLQFDLIVEDSIVRYIEKTNIESSRKIRTIIVLNKDFECVKVKPVFREGSIEMDYGGGVDYVSSRNGMTKWKGYFVNLHQPEYAYKPYEILYTEVELKDFILKNTSNIKEVLVMDSVGKITKLKYDFNGYEVKFDRGNTILRDIREYKKLIKIEDKRIWKENKKKR